MEHLPTPGHLYTWVNIDEHFARLASHGEWPDWLLEVDAYWDGVDIAVTEETDDRAVWHWLTERLGPLTVDRQRQELFLESLDGSENALPVRINPSAEPGEISRRPQWGERRIVRDLSSSLPAPESETLPHEVRICAFHSFKGGVGRTLHCVALALALAKRGTSTSGQDRRVLLIDADLDAPGISWMVSGDGSRSDIALDDFLALLHGSSPSDREQVIALARKFLINQEQDGVLVLPTTRDTTRIGPARIQPADLLTSPERPPYFLTEAFAELTYAVGADTCLIDLRSGTSELSAPILLDPRVQRVFVSTINDQSVQGTVNLLRQLAHRAPSSRPTDPACAVLITQFQEDEHSAELASASATLADAVAETFHLDADDDLTLDRQVVSKPLCSPFQPQLLALPRSWSDVRERIEQASLGAALSVLTDSLVPAAIPSEAHERAGIQERRQRLAQKTEELIYAERAVTNGEFMSTQALQNLAQAHKTSAPVVVSVGAKGSGKTFTYLLMCRQRTWSAFGEKAGTGEIELNATLVPVLASENLTDELRNDIVSVRDSSAQLLVGRTPASFQALRDFIREALGGQRSEVQWRRVWLTCMARAAGLDATPETVETELASLARGKRAIFVIDGLEELFQEFSTDQQQQRALRVLLMDCPEWLRSLRGLPLGLVVFVRRDLVTSSIRQNVGQFLDRYRPYELRWNRNEALRLVAWVCERARVLTHPGQTDARDTVPDDLSELLVQVWGWKLGSDNSREARSEEWFLAALSDYNLQIQARDIVSFLSHAARGSFNEGNAIRWEDRLLTPQGMRNALPASSEEKIEAIAQENPPVGKIFNHLKNDLSEEVRKIPFTLSETGLDPNDVQLLEAHGALYRENDQYWIPEIYRHGLLFRNKTARPSIVSINKVIRSRGGSRLQGGGPSRLRA